MKNQFKIVIKTFVFVWVFFLGTQAIYAAWVAPTATPPNDNVTLNFGPFSTTGFVTSNEGGVYATDNFIFGGPQLDDDGDTSHDERMFFNKDKGAFRAGRTLGNYWDDVNVGQRSVAFGYNTAATASYSSAFGYNSFAQNTGAFAMGYQTKAKGRYSLSAGSSTMANADHSTAFGEGVYNDSSRSFMVGFKSAKDTSNTTDPGLFVNSSNNVGIGTSVVSAGLRLNVAGKVGATEYCDENGANCTLAASIGSGGTYGIIANQGLIMSGNNFGLSDVCSDGQILKRSGANWACSVDNTGAGGSVDSIIAGTGIITSGSTGDVTVSSSLGTSISSSEITDGTITSSDINTGSVQRRVSSSCAAGSSIRAISSTGGVTCETDDSGSGWSACGTIESNCNYVNESGDTMTGNLNMNNHQIRKVDVLGISTGGFIMGETSPLTIATHLEMGGEIDMNYNWLRDVNYDLNNCYWTGGGPGNMFCNNGYVVRGANVDGTGWISLYCCH